MTKGISSKSVVADEDGNAYTSSTDDDWTLPSEDRESLSSSIRQHAAILKGEDGDIILDDDKPAERPLGSDLSASRSQRSFSSLNSGKVQSDTKGGKSSARSIPSGSASPAARRPTPPSALRSSSRYSKSSGSSKSVGGKSAYSYGTPGTKAAIQTNKPRGSGTKLRALIALVCLILAILLAVLVAYGAPGRWITEGLIGTIPGSTAIKEPPTTTGIPGAIGSTPAYNGTFDLPDLESMNIILPDAIENGFGDWRIPFPASNRTDLPVYWLLAKSGGTVVQRILGQCLGLVEVSKEGEGHEESTLQIFETSSGTRYMNVDSTTAAGLQRAKDLGLVKSTLADSMFTPLITQAATIFTPENKGRFFSIFRHPIVRAMGVYHAAKSTDPVVASMTLAEFAQFRLPNNEMVRTLASKGLSDDLTDDDLYLAMEIIRRKCVVGLVDRMEESMVRFHGYFGWYALMVDGVSQCQSTLLAPANAQVPLPAEGTEAYTFMMAQNRLDLRLYDYILYLYDVQGGNTRTE